MADRIFALTDRFVETDGTNGFFGELVPNSGSWPIGGARFDKIVARKLTQRCWDEWPLWSRQIAIRCARLQPTGASPLSPKLTVKNERQEKFVDPDSSVKNP